MIRIMAIGRIKNSAYNEAISDYSLRARRFANFRIEEIPDSNPETESRKLLAAAKGTPRVACDLRGELWSSQQMADFLGRHGSPCFFLGGPDGFTDLLREGVDFSLKMSGFTLPHELARLVLVEQIYRGLTLLRGHPYHR